MTNRDSVCSVIFHLGVKSYILRKRKNKRNFLGIIKYMEICSARKSVVPYAEMNLIAKYLVDRALEFHMASDDYSQE